MPVPAASHFVFTSAQLPWLLLGAFGGYLLMMFSNPSHEAFRDGFRAVRRYPTLWLAFGAFGFTNMLFRLAIRIYGYCVLPPEDRPVFMWMRAAWRDPKFWLTGSPESLWYLPPHGLSDALRDAVLPAGESLTGIFNNLISTFPLAVLAAVFLLSNWDGHQVVLLRAMRRRYRAWGWLAYFGILVCALAVIAKLLLYAAPPLLHLEGTAALLWFQWSPVVVWLAFLFEYLFGVCIQIYLILLAYCWVRGLTFEHAHLLDFAIRRFAFVVKWAAVVMVLSSVLVDLPLILKNFTAFQGVFPAEDATVESRLRVGRVALTVFLLIFPAMQITLTFHNESLRQALRDQLRFLLCHWWPCAWFFIVAGVHCLLFHGANLLCLRALGEGTAAGIFWSALAAVIYGVMGAWLLASWVCVYKRFDHGRDAHESWIKF